MLQFDVVDSKDNCWYCSADFIFFFFALPFCALCKRACESCSKHSLISSFLEITDYAESSTDKRLLKYITGKHIIYFRFDERQHIV